MLTLNDVLETKGRHVEVVRPDCTVRAALTILAEKNIGTLLVVDEADEVIGVFGERDFTRHALEQQEHIFEICVETLMSRHLHIAEPSMTIDACMALMTTERIRHVPVFDHGKLAGVVSIGDVVKAIVDMQASTIEQLEEYIASGR